MGIDCLALIAVLMFPRYVNKKKTVCACSRPADRLPRLAFVTLKNNVMVLALRAMIAQFVVLMLIAVFCFGGFLYGLWTSACFLCLIGAILLTW